MLTRAILLLLAMMTGFSAAQAAERARPDAGVAGVSAVQRLFEHGEARGEAAAARSWLALAGAPARAPAMVALVQAPSFAGSAPVFRSDRARE